VSRSVCEIRATHVGILRQSCRGRVADGGQLPEDAWCTLYRLPAANTISGAPTRSNSVMCLDRLWGAGRRESERAR